MKKIVCIISCCVLSGVALQAQTVTDSMKNKDEWKFIGGSMGGLTNRVNGLNPVEGTSFYYMYTYADWVNGSLYKDIGITLEEGKTYRISVILGDEKTITFMPSTSMKSPFNHTLSFGFFTNAVASAADVRDAIMAFGKKPDLRVKNFSSPVPVNGWKTWSYDLAVAKNSSLNGVKVYFGIGWNSGDLTGVKRGIAIDTVSISVISDSSSDK